MKSSIPLLLCILSFLSCNPNTSNQRILITYGAGHKGWFHRALRKRTDIKLLELADVVTKE